MCHDAACRKRSAQRSAKERREECILQSHARGSRRSLRIITLKLCPDELTDCFLIPLTYNIPFDIFNSVDIGDPKVTSDSDVLK